MSYLSTVKRSDGRILTFSMEDFYNLLVKGNHCFICGAAPGTKSFNNEHIIPDWLLRRYDLYNQKIMLPNEAFVNYRTYTIPCCQECNSELSAKLEKPVSGLLKKSYMEISDALDDQENIFLLLRWMCLVYLKIHLKDTNYRWERDKRKNTGMIGDYHDWRHLHFIHSIARTHHLNTVIESEAFGTMLFLPVFSISNQAMFDYVDYPQGRTILIQVDELCIIACLDDACAGFNFYQDELHRISGPLTKFQLRELLTLIGYLNVHIKYRPKFHATISNEKVIITVKKPLHIELNRKDEVDAPSMGEMLYYYIRDIIPKSVPNREAILTEIRNGKRRFLFDSVGKFQDPRIAH